MYVWYGMLSMYVMLFLQLYDICCVMYVCYARHQQSECMHIFYVCMYSSLRMYVCFVCMPVTYVYMLCMYARMLCMYVNSMYALCVLYVCTCSIDCVYVFMCRCEYVCMLRL